MSIVRSIVRVNRITQSISSDTTCDPLPLLHHQAGRVFQRNTPPTIICAHTMPTYYNKSYCIIVNAVQNQQCDCIAASVFRYRAI